MTKIVGDISKLYYEQYFDNTSNKGFNGWLFAFTHKKLEIFPNLTNDQKRKTSFNILEVGGGSGQHLHFVKQIYEKYVLTDINPLLLPKNTHKSKLKGIRYKVADVQNLPFKPESFDRVIMTCLLHHLNDVEKALSEIDRVTKNGGLVSIYVSCDPGLLNRLLRRLLIMPKAKKMGFFEYELLIAREHRNHFQSIKTMICNTFNGQSISIKYYPFRIRSWNINTFCIFQIQIISKVY